MSRQVFVARAPARPVAAEIRYGPVVASCPHGTSYWLIATSAGAFALPDFAAIQQLPPAQFVAAVLACGEWALIDGEPQRWNHEREQWEMALL